MSAFRCDACGVMLPAGSCKAKIGSREFCGPDNSPCHALGLRSATWRITEAERGNCSTKRSPQPKAAARP